MKGTDNPLYFKQTNKQKQEKNKPERERRQQTQYKMDIVAKTASTATRAVSQHITNSTYNKNSHKYI